MIAVYIDENLKTYEKQIKYSIDLIFNTIGMQFRYVNHKSQLKDRDIAVFYTMTTLGDESLRDISTKWPVIVIPAYTTLYTKNMLRKQDVSRLLKGSKDHPYLSNVNTDIPLVVSFNNGCCYGQLNYDLFSNVYFHLTMDEIPIKSTVGELSQQDVDEIFAEYYTKPFVNAYLWILERLIEELVNHKGSFIVKKDHWPKGESMAFVLTNNVARVQKWTIKTILSNILDNFTYLLSFRVTKVARNVKSLLNYIFTNIEEYWNFEEIKQIEEKSELKSTWFFNISTESNQDSDYWIDDPAILEEIENLRKSGHEVGFNVANDFNKNEYLKIEIQKFSETLKLSLFGVRYPNSRMNNQETLELLDNSSVQYISSLGSKEKNGFLSGIGFPYKIQGTQNAIYEIPINIIDKALYIDKHTYIDFDLAKEKVKELLNTCREYSGLIGIQSDTTNYVEIHYYKKAN